MNGFLQFVGSLAGILALLVLLVILLLVSYVYLMEELERRTTVAERKRRATYFREVGQALQKDADYFRGFDGPAVLRAVGLFLTDHDDLALYAVARDLQIASAEAAKEKARSVDVAVSHAAVSADAPR